MDLHFTVELGKEGNPGAGGNGFGLIICMDDLCWDVSRFVPPPKLRVYAVAEIIQETFLDPDPTRSLVEQRKNGLGSMFNYVVSP